MAKIGRNELCPCGSGLKYKRCCLTKSALSEDEVSAIRQMKISLMDNIAKIQKIAHNREEAVREFGVFVLWANTEGDAWLLEISESDAVQVARAGEALEPPINEAPEIIEIEWSHTFAVREKRFFITAYADKVETCLETAPVQRINAAIRKIRKKYPDEVLNQVHLDPSEVEAAS